MNWWFRFFDVTNRLFIVFVFVAKSLFTNFYLGTIHNRRRFIFPIFRPTPRVSTPPVDAFYVYKINSRDDGIWGQGGHTQILAYQLTISVTREGRFCPPPPTIFWIPIPSASIMDVPLRKKYNNYFPFFVIPFMTMNVKPLREEFFHVWYSLCWMKLDTGIFYRQSFGLYSIAVEFSINAFALNTNIHWFCQSVQKNSFDNNAEQMFTFEKTN